jgi:hypothetical protein
MSFNDRTVQTCVFGEQLLDKLIRQQEFVPYYPEKGVAHPFDRLIASRDKRRLAIVEIKTKCRRVAYPDTGINLSHYRDYFHITAQYSVPLFLAFVDAKLGQMYGGWFHDLIKTREPSVRAQLAGCKSYPWTCNGIVYFPLSAMRVLYALTREEREALWPLRQTMWIDGEKDYEWVGDGPSPQGDGSFL